VGVRMKRALTTKDAFRLITQDRNPVRQLVSLLAYSGLSVADIANPCLTVHSTQKSIPNRGADRGLSLKVARALLVGVNDLRDECIIRCGLFLGLRQVEMRRLDVSDMSVDSRMKTYLAVKGKGGGKRDVFVPLMLAQAMWGLRSSSGPLFTNRSGGRLSENGIRSIINRYLKPLAPRATAHSLRHTCVTWLLESGAPMQAAMEIVGHSEAASHELYAAASGRWLFDSWAVFHPLADQDDMGSIVLPGAPYERRMCAGTERVVPVSRMTVGRAMVGMADLPDTPRALSRLYADYPTSPTALRTAAAVHMTEAGAHPMLVSMVLGVTPGYVVGRGYGRMGLRAAEERERVVEAIESEVSYWTAADMAVGIL
jgi:site-specific recombinase XerC